MMQTLVVTADQRDSRRADDLVPAVLDHLNAAAYAGRPRRRFERTAGDEVQGVLRDAEQLTARLPGLLRTGRWSVGIGVGPVVEPLPRSTRAGAGPAFVHARNAVEAAKSAPGRVSVRAEDPVAAARLETVLMLWAALLDRRTDAGWEVAGLLEEGLTHAAAAERLGISQPAVSQRARAAAVRESVRAATLVTDLLRELLED